jgi:UDP-N-acetylmuramyl pentapeptide synthase
VAPDRYCKWSANLILRPLSQDNRDMKSFVINMLSRIARKKLKQFKPTIIGVTGSVGKTSTRSAIAIALGAKYRVRTPLKNYNNEIGLPLAILGERSPGKSAWEWLKLFWRARKIKDVPEYFVLEYGIDHPGDMTRLLSVAKPNYAVITALSPVHAENYPSFDALINEKAKLGEVVPDTGAVLLNGDDTQVAALRTRFQAATQTYSLTHGDAYASDIRTRYAREESFDVGELFVETRAILHVGNQSAELVLSNCVSTTLVSSALAACAVAVHYGVNLADAVAALSQKLTPVNGRLRPLAGVKGSLLIDDTYNAAPASMVAGLQALAAFIPGQEYDRRIAVLGDMAELGAVSEAEHRALGEWLAKSADMFVAVGPQMQMAAEAAQAAGMPREQIEWFKDAVEAGRYLDRVVQTGDVVFVKGSQSMRMEKIVKDIMAEPQRATELLVRQEDNWL